MRTFFIIWFGQLISTIGSRMTSFALGLWAWEITGEATTLALVVFFRLLPTILIAPVAGVIVDSPSETLGEHWNRKHLMILGDAVAFLSTLILLLLYWSHQLQIWHIYAIGAIDSTFGQLQGLAYSASIPLMVPKQHHTRVSSMGFFSYYGSEIIAPAFAGTLYPIIGLVGIMLIDGFTFLFAMSTLWFAVIPLPIQQSETSRSSSDAFNLQSLKLIWQSFCFGLNYIMQRPSLGMLLAMAAAFKFFWAVSDAIYSPLILARTGNNARILGIVLSAAGFGGVVSALIFSIWGGFSKRIRGVSFGMIGIGLSKMIFGYGQTTLIWIPSQFCASANVTLQGSSKQSLFLSKVSPQMQGRVFSILQMAQQITVAIAYLMAGPLADQIFEPAMQQGGFLSSHFGNLLGTGTGSGIALLFVLCAACMVSIGIISYVLPSLRNIEHYLPDHGVHL